MHFKIRIFYSELSTVIFSLKKKNENEKFKSKVKKCKKKTKSHSFILKLIKYYGMN